MKILTLARFGDSEDVLKREEWVEYVFTFEDVSSCNESSLNCTTLRFKSGYDQSVAIKWNIFRDLFIDDTRPIVNYVTMIDPEIAYKSNYKPVTK
jgi:hypothetical protein